MELGGKVDFPRSSLTVLPTNVKAEVAEQFAEVRENESGAVRKHPSILLTDGRTLNFKRLDRKRVSFGRNTEFPISQVSLPDSDAAMVISAPLLQSTDAFSDFLSAPLTVFRENQSLSEDGLRAAHAGVEQILSATAQLNEELFTSIGISFNQPSEAMLSELTRTNAVLETRIRELKESVEWTQARIEKDRSEAGAVEMQLTAAEAEAQKAAEATVASLQQTKEQLASQVSLYKRLTGISLPSFSGQVLTGVCKGKQDGELKFELRFRKEGGCDYRPVGLRMHGLDEMLKHPITGLAECELVMIFRRMLQAVVYRDS